eukprot:TRINITY_DN43358_c0_g1_i1.p1 TRINITY_DN43358_c0_g1~~TRINITY_DN43358_c0_g1_i1.p1  ORF type:complete len:1284 (-),score=266.81 TRINITY_DN43358_c0_g1_i1:135-3986(-)
MLSTDSAYAKEDVLHKKSHHIGFWKQRFFRFDGRTLRYWKHKRLALQLRPARGEIPLAGCSVVAGPGSRFIIKVPSGAYDEELEAKDCKDRDEWIYSLNTASLSERQSLSKQLGVEDFLRAKDLWEPLEEAAAEAAAAYVASTVVGMDEVISIGDLALRHVRFGAALVRRAGQPEVKPRQGRLVHAGRRFRKRLGSEHHKEPSSPDAADALDTLESTEFWLLLMSSRLLSEAAEEVSLGAGSLLKEPRSMPLSFEVLHAFADPMESSGPVVSLPLASCDVGEVAYCKDGSGWSLKLYEADEPGGCVSQGAALWSIILESREECELWRKAAQAARWAARAQAHGRERAAEEALAAFNRSPGEWRKAAAKRLEDVSMYAPPLPTLARALSLKAWASPNQRLKKRISLGGDVTPGTAGGGSVASSCSSSSMPGMTATAVGGYSSSTAAPPLGATEAACEAVRKVLAACEDVCTEAEGLLEAALAQHPLRKDAAGAALRCALVPALSTAGRCWSKWSGDLPQGEARALLRWLEARRQAARSLGLVCPPPLETALPGLASELSLRMGTYLRKLTEELLVAELGERLRQASGSSARDSRRGSFESIGSTGTGMPGRSEAEVFAVSTLPVDFFTFLNSCLLMDRDQGVPELRLCTLRVTQFMVKEVQESLWGWLQATLPAVPRDWRPRPGAAQDALPTLMRRWFWGVASLANAMPAFQQNLSELEADSASSDDSDDEVPEDQDATSSVHAYRSRRHTRIGPQLFSKEWRFEKQEKDFEALLEAFLWAACDVASGRWRKQILNEAFPLQEGGAAVAVPLLGPLLSVHLDPCLSPLRGWLDPSLFERLLRKLFVVCICCLVVKLSRGSWLQALTREKKEERLSEEASFLCLYFGGLSSEPRGVSDGGLLWDSERVASVFHAVLLSLHPVERTRSSPQQPRQSPKRREPLPHDKKGSLGFEDGLSKLVPVLTDGPLPLREVLNWFCNCGVPCQGDLQELPRPVPSGGLYLHPAEAQDRRRSSQAWEDIKLSGSTSVSSWEDSFASVAGSENPRRYRPSVGLSLFGEAPSEQMPVPRMRFEEDACYALGLASEGALCELRVEQVGAYGAFCNVVRQKEPGAQPSKPRRRWLHLSKASPQETPLFQLLHAQPASAQAVPDATQKRNVSLPLASLKEASFKSAASLDLVFSGGSGGDGPEVLVQYSLSFDCPSHLFRVRLVLERWWDQQQFQELRPVVTYTPSARSERPGATPREQLPEENSWRGLAGPLRREVLEARLGGLWSDVRKRLEAAMAT